MIALPASKIFASFYRPFLAYFDAIINISKISMTLLKEINIKTGKM